MEQLPLVIIVAGPPARGKTTLARSLVADLRLPLFAKDDFKELLFDSLGWSDRDWSRKLGGASMRLLFATLETELHAARSCIVEANFSVEHDAPQFADLQARYPFSAFQIQCYTQGETLYERFKARAQSNARHPGHAEQGQCDEHRMTLLRGSSEPLPLAGVLHEVDTTDFSALDLAPLLAALRAALADGASA